MSLLLAMLACTSDDGTPIVLKPATADTAGAGNTVEIVDRAMGTGLQDDAFGTFKRGRGCTVSDLDLDGDLDLVLSNPADASYVLLNDGRGGFTPGPILDTTELIWAAAAADMDGDGDEDLFLAVGGLEGLGMDRLLRNNRVETGQLTFTDVTATAGVAGPIGRTKGYENPVAVASLGGAWVDYDGDADLDIYVDTTPWPVLWAEDLPEDSVIGRNLLWRNNGDGTFTDVAEEAGLSWQGSSRYSSWLDIDNDGDLDLFENNKDSKPNVLWRNDGGVFTDVTDQWALDGGDLGYPLETFASAAGDVNHDGWEDLLLFVRGLAVEGPYLLGHTLLLNAQGRGFVDATLPSNLNDPFYSGYRDHLSNGVMGATWRDLDGDGLLDLFAGNGGPGSGFPNMMAHATGLVPTDLGSEAGILDVPVYEDWSDRYQFPAAEDASTLATYPGYPYRTHAGCVADLDGDGQAELMEMNGGMSWVGGDAVKEPNRWFHVVQSVPPGSVSVELVGDGISVAHTPIGTRVEVVVLDQGVERTLWDTLRSASGFAAQHGTRIHVGTGGASEVLRVTAHWPDGTTTTVESVSLGERVILRR